MIKRITYSIAILSIMAIIVQSCTNDSILDDPNARLEFSLDTLTFDTVFTAIGSTTRSFKVYNPNFPNDEITIRMLLSHVSSIRDNWEKLEIGYTIDNGGDSPMSIEDYLKSYLLEGGEYYDRETSIRSIIPNDTISGHTWQILLIRSPS